MKRSHLTLTTLLGVAALLAITFAARAQVLIDDNMEGYPTATATSVFPHAANPDPAYWESVVYSGSGTVTASGGIVGANGTRAAVMSADFSAAGGTFAGSILNSHAYPIAATQGNALKDFHYSVDLRGSQAAAVTVVFVSVNAAFAITGSIAKTFTLTAANIYQPFSGNLAEPGWAPDSSKVGGAPLDLHAPYYGWSVLIHAENPGGWGFDSGNVLNFDNVKLTATAGGSTYLPVTYDTNGFFHLNSGQSPYVGYKPHTYSDANPTSLLVWMHGCGGNAEGDMWSIAPPSTRQTQSYIAISIGGRDGDCWSVGTDTPKVLAAITDVARYFNINPRKVYLGGYSSGGDMTYRVGFENTSLFAGLLVENSDPFRDTGRTQAQLLASASWKINVAHLAHLSDAVYPIAGVRTNLATLTANGFPVTKIEKAGTHYDPDNGAFGTNYDLIHSLLPFVDAGWVSPGGPPAVGGDFNGDGKPDFFFVKAGTGQTAIWHMNGPTFINAILSKTVPAGWSVVGTGDFNSDRKPDLLLFNPTSRATAIWHMNDATFIKAELPPSVPAGWIVAGVADFNGDGKPDILFFNPTGRQTAIWYMNGSAFIKAVLSKSVPAGWTIAGLGDFNSDGKPDLLLFNPTGRQTAIWYMSDALFKSAVLGPNVAAPWTISGVADFNLDGKPDLLFFNPSTRGIVICYMNGPKVLSAVTAPTVPADWDLVAP